MNLLRDPRLGVEGGLDGAVGAGAVVGQQADLAAPLELVEDHEVRGDLAVAQREVVDAVEPELATGALDALEAALLRAAEAPAHEHLVALLAQREHLHAEVGDGREGRLEVGADLVRAVAVAVREALVGGVRPQHAHRLRVVAVELLERPADDLPASSQSRAGPSNRARGTRPPAPRSAPRRARGARSRAPAPPPPRR